MAFDMLRSRPLLGLVVGFSLPLLLTAPGCLRTLDESRIGENNSTGGGAGNGGGGGSDGSSAGSGGRAGGGGTSGADGGGDANTDAPVDARPEAGFTAYDQSKHPVTNVLGGAGNRLVAVDSTTVYATSYDEVGANLVSIPLAGGQVTPVTSVGLSRPQALVAPVNSNSIFYVGSNATGTSGLIGRFLKNTDGGANPETSITVNGGFELARGLYAASDNNAYVSAESKSGGPVLLKFSLAASTTAAAVLLPGSATSETGGPITVSQGCVYWISNGGVWVMPTSGGAAQPAAALGNQISDAIDIASDKSNIYFTRKTGEVWQRQLSGSCDGSGPPEKPIAWGYTNINHVDVYDTTVVWTARGNASSNYDGGGIFTTAVGGYDVVQVAPPDDGVDDMAIGPNEFVYSTLSGFVRKVPK